MLINSSTIITDSNPIIREKSEDVAIPLSKEDEQLAYEMLQYVKDSINEELAEKYDLKPAVGISAIQLGIKKKITAIYIVKQEDEDGNIIKASTYLFANARITSRSVQKAYLKNGEGCLSVEDVHDGYVIRSARVTVEAYDIIKQENVTLRIRGFDAIVVQHELDHFDGTLFYDHIRNDDPFKAEDDDIAI